MIVSEGLRNVFVGFYTAREQHFRQLSSCTGASSSIIQKPKGFAHAPNQVADGIKMPSFSLLGNFRFHPTDRLAIPPSNVT